MSAFPSSRTDPPPLDLASWWPLQARHAHCLSLGAAGGFSGSRFWRVTGREGQFCLRRWPPKTTRSRIREIHAVLAHAAARGCAFVPTPCPARDGQTAVEHVGHCWELTPWLPGTADFLPERRTARLVTALEALAAFHRATETFPPQEPPRPSPGLAERRARLERLLHEGFERLAEAVAAPIWPELAERARRWLALAREASSRVLPLLVGSSAVNLPSQYVLRDIHADHVLFSGNRVTGIVDFDALRRESVAADLARLLGSLVSDDADRWRTGLAAYERLRPLSDGERAAVTAFDRANVLLTPGQWLEWVYIEGRVFENRSAVLARMDAAVARLERLDGPDAGNRVLFL